MITMPLALTTKRLYLRPPCPDTDLQAIYVYSSDPETTRYMIWCRVQTLDEVHDFLEDVAVGWEEGDDFCYVLIRHSDQELLGAVSCQFDQHGAEIGFIVHARYWGQGYAPEAMQALIEQIWSIADVYRIWATCDVRNHASARVMEKLGMRHEGTLGRWAVSPNADAHNVPADAHCFALVRQ